MSEVVIDEGNYLDSEFHDPVIDNGPRKRGLIPRDFSVHPVGSLMYAKPWDLPLIPESEWADRLKQQKADKAQLTDVRNISGPDGKPFPSRDQDGFGYCWAHSSTTAAMYVRARQGQTYADLSAFAVACIIKNYRDEGGWGGESLQFIAERGIPTSQFWPQQSTNRSNDNSNTWTNASLHKFTDWRDLDDGSNPTLLKQQLITALLMGFPVVVDYNWWSHSVCAVNLEDLSPFTIRIHNSWGDSWSDNGTGLLVGSRAMPDGALVAIVQTPSEL